MEAAFCKESVLHRAAVPAKPRQPAAKRQIIYGSVLETGKPLRACFLLRHRVDANEEVTVYDARFYRAGTIERGSYVYDEADKDKSLFLRDIPARYFSEVVWPLWQPYTLSLLPPEISILLNMLFIFSAPLHTARYFSEVVWQLAKATM